jgi:hypothetical protein
MALEVSISDFFANIDWWVFEDPATACDMGGNMISAAELNRPFAGGENAAFVVVDVHRYAASVNQHQVVRLPSGRTPFEIMSAIRNFYIRDMTPTERANYLGNIYDQTETVYSTVLAQRIRDNLPTRWLDAIGSEELFAVPPNGTRRHPLACAGRVRVESLRTTRNANVYVLECGS